MSSTLWEKQGMPSRDFLTEGGQIFVTRRNKIQGQDIKKKSPQSNIYIDLKPVLFLAQCLFLFPLYGLFQKNHQQIEFKLRSFKVICSLVMIILTCFLVLLSASRLVYEELKYHTIGQVVFYSTTVFSMVEFFKLAPKWKTIMNKWAATEEILAEFEPNNISLKIKIISGIVLISSICEHLLANMETLASSSEENEATARAFYERAFRHVFAIVNFSIWKGIIMSCINFFVTMIWNYTDLFLMTISMELSSNFTRFNLHLKKLARQDISLEQWSKTREAYNNLANLTKLMDKKLSNLIIISFASNLYFICLQLLNSLNPNDSVVKSIYFAVSLAHLVLRTAGVCLAASSIYEKSKLPLEYIFSLPRKSYNVEVERLFAQISTDTIALTGCNFFIITRTLMLTVAGTIATYEIVLVQFNNISSN